MRKVEILVAVLDEVLIEASPKPRAPTPEYFVDSSYGNLK